ncbi:MAG: AI-2E family transporter [Desulfohalobiaceae bacterium]|nr:AI-2E family transporter [Desulfohalobiaceae bacterium]
MILNAVLIILGVYFSVAGLIQAKGFLMPLAIAGLLAMLMLPFSNILERWMLGRTVASFVSITFLLALAIGFNFLLVKEIQKFAQDIPEMLDNLQPRLDRLNAYISEKTGVSPWQQKQQLLSIIKDRMVNIGSNALSLISNVRDFLMATLLVLVYTFFFMLYRERFSRFFLMLIAEDKRSEAREIIHGAGRIAQHYLLGRIILILFLALIYYIGFFASGLKHTLFLAGLVAALSLIPYLGNIIGLFLALGVGLLTGLGAGQLIEILVIFGAAQLIESYVLEPYVVGQQVELNAVITIIAIVLGGAVWGVAGVIIALPVVGMAKVICDHVPALQPFGYLLGEDGHSTMDRLSAFKKNIFDKVFH